MTKKWHSSTHPISDIRDWNSSGTLIVQPDYQRREVWGPAARIMLMDSIINGIPMPKIFVSSLIKDGRTFRTVIDGQQRITAILDFLANEFTLDVPYQGQYAGKTFSDLPPEIRDDVVLAYEIDFNEAKGLQDAELREVYSRVNKYLVALNRQELRKADYPGDFLNISELLANLEFFDEAGLYTTASRRRSLDVEFTSELLCGLVLGISERKDAIDHCYQKYSTWEKGDRERIAKEFEEVISDISKLFPAEVVQLKKTRWKQKADFYSMFLAISRLRREGLYLPENMDALRKDLEILNKEIAPTSEIKILSEYAVYCVSQANSASSRIWRTNFMEGILRGSYAGSIINENQRQVIFDVAVDIRYAVDPTYNGEGCPPTSESVCPICGKVEIGAILADAALVWPNGTKAFQFSNAQWAHRACCEKGDGYVVLLATEFKKYCNPDED